MSSPTLYLDEDSSEHAVLNALREAGYDVTSAVEEGRANRDISDQEQLEYASSEGRMLFSFNKQDYIPIHKKWFEQGREHCGILLAEKQKSTTKSLISEIAKFLEAYTKEEAYNQIFHL